MTEKEDEHISRVPPKEPTISSARILAAEDLIDNENSVDTAIEKRFVWKLDLIVLPLLAIIYFTNSLDRANLGNAKTDGIEDDLNMKVRYT